ncbi:MAG TPA: TerC family protein, partial [Kaistiaceae bacterium]|nr:TerC family protein [Kaistiaceae bacterium]
MLELLTDPQVWAALVTLTVMEIVLGIDNIVFISIVVARLPSLQAKRARQIGLFLALGFRIALLSVLTWLIGLTEPLFTVMEKAISWRDLILILGGLFLFYKATTEIHNGIEGEDEHGPEKKQASFLAIVAQIIVIDIIFSID